MAVSHVLVLNQSPICTVPKKVASSLHLYLLYMLKGDGWGSFLWLHHLWTTLKKEKGHTNPTSSLTKKQRKISLTTEHDFRLSPKKGGKIPHVCHLILREINLKRLRPVHDYHDFIF